MMEVWVNLIVLSFCNIYMYQITILYTLKFYVNVNNISIKLENKKRIVS